jgi:hypothetical protein
MQDFGETLDQLFGYQTWRDTKLAILMFVGRRDLTQVINRAREVLVAHPQFVGWEDDPQSQSCGRRSPGTGTNSVWLIWPCSSSICPLLG